MKALLKRIMQATPYRIVRATARNRFSAHQADFVFVRADSKLNADRAWA